MIDLMPIFLSLKLAMLTTLILFGVGLVIAYCLVFLSFKNKEIIETIINIPIILPPSVLGFYLLFIFNPDSLIGSFLTKVFHSRILFSFTGILIASLIFSLPIMVNFLKAGFKSFPQNLLDAAKIMGKGRIEILLRVILPYCRASVISGMIMTFAHTIGAFGILMMIGGNIPGQTQLASIAIFNEIECLNYSKAHVYSIILTAVTFLLLFVMLKINRKKEAC
ncbi:MAG: molybdate ABC transporter permease subunit [Candidatus Omnitrophica bacterium]|nr:molybdate ABC transporter permease subunit [Candidatus Omnitrophota bacterium]